MATKEQVIERLSSAPDEEFAVAIWCTEDVKGRAKDRNIELTDEQAKEIVSRIDRKQDCEYGITWLTLDIYTDMQLEDE